MLTPILSRLDGDVLFAAALPEPYRTRMLAARWRVDLTAADLAGC